MMARLRLAARLAGRELRGGISGFAVFLASLALGVAAIAAVGTLSEAIRAALVADARVLLGGDLDLRLVQRPPSPEEAAYLRAHAAVLSEVVEMRAMARPEGQDRTALVELKAVDAAYPLVGSVAVAPPEALSSLLAVRDGVAGAIADPALFERLGLGLGDRIRVGDATFELRGRISREPDRIASVVSFGPRLMITLGALGSTNLAQPGALMRHATRVILPPGIAAESWTAAVRAAFPEAGWRIVGPAEAAPSVERLVERLGMFLGFAGLTALLIGGVGIANAVRAYLDGKARTIVMIKCLGASSGLIMTVYLLQVLLLAGLGIAFGLALGAVLPLLLIDQLARLLPLPLAPGFYPGAYVSAAALGLLTALTFSLWPLARAGEVPAADLFRESVAPLAGRPRPPWLWATTAAVASLAAVTIVTAADHGFAAIFAAGAAAVFGFLGAGAAATRLVVRRLPRLGTASLRLALGGLRRPAAPTATIIVSLGAGLTVLVAVALIDHALRTQIRERLPAAAPAIFFIDIQDDQVAPFEAAVTAIIGAGALERVPVLRGRIVAIAGVPVDKAPVTADAAWAVQGDRALTFSAEQPDDARIVAGAWWPADYAGPPLISLDAGLARGFGIGIGDRLTLNILGRDIETKIASLRRIDWSAVPFDFAIIFAPGTLEGAPHTHVAAAYAPPELEIALEKAISDRFPNITAIRTRDAIETVNGVVRRIATGVRIATAVTILAGIFVLTGAIAADRRRRDYEAVLFKVFGATRRRLARIYALEYGLLGLIAAVLAAGLGTVIAWAIIVFLMHMEWSFSGGVIAATLAISVAVTLVLGFAGTYRQLGRKAAAYLRNE